MVMVLMNQQLQVQLMIELFYLVDLFLDSLLFNQVYTNSIQRGYVEIQKKDNEGKERACGYGEYPPMTPEEKERYEILKHQAQIKKMQELIDRKNKEKNGAKYKKMYEEQCKSQRNIMYCLSRSGAMDTEGIMQLFGYTDRHQYYNAIVKAKKEAEGEP